VEKGKERREDYTGDKKKGFPFRRRKGLLVLGRSTTPTAIRYEKRKGEGKEKRRRF